MNVWEFIDTTNYADIIQEAERRGYRRSDQARLHESFGHRGVSLDEAVDYLRHTAYDAEFRAEANDE